MKFELKTNFDSVEDAVAYLKSDVSSEIGRLETATSAFESEKAKLLKKRDELLSEAKAAKAKYKKFEGHEDVDVEELIAFKEAHSGDESAIEERYRAKAKADQTKFEKRLEAIEKERESEKKAAAAEREARIAAQIKSDAIAELSQEKHKIIRADEFWTLFASNKVQRDDETGDLFVGDEYKKLSLPEYIAEVAENPDNQHHFRASGHSGSGGKTGIAGTAKQKSWKEMNTTERSMLFRTNEQKARQLAAEAGMPFKE